MTVDLFSMLEAHVASDADEDTLTQFMERRIIVPSGKYAGRHFRYATQPVIGVLHREYETGKYNRVAVMACTQSGKTLSSFIAPVMYQIFGKREPAGVGVPTDAMGRDKWRVDLMPAIKRGPFAHYLPSQGAGSRDGYSELLELGNGTYIRFFSGGGGDKTVAGFAGLRMMAISETDGMDKIKARSDEADRITQMEQRLVSHGLGAECWLECTASTESGRINVEYEQGTHTRLMSECPYCHEGVLPEREHLFGWQDAEGERDAIGGSYFVCPQCEHPLTESDRTDMLSRAYPVHERPKSMTLSVRWSGWHNMFWTPGYIGLREWKAQRNPDRESADREMSQFVWARPISDPRAEDLLEPIIDLSRYTEENVPTEQRYLQGVVPEWADYLTLGVDVGAKRLHWSLIAWAQNATSHIVDYGQIQNPYKDYGQEHAVKMGLADIKSMSGQAWQQVQQASAHKIDLGLVDAGWLPEVVRGCCSGVLLPAVGLGQTNSFRRLKRDYRQPTKTGTEVLKLGEGWHLIRRKPTKGGSRYRSIEHDVDFGKTWVHRRLATPQGQPGGMTFFFSREPDAHAEFVAHLTAEQQVIQKGIVTWQKKRDKNHWLDSTVLAATAARVLGVKADAENARPAQTSRRRQSPGLTQKKY